MRWPWQRSGSGDHLVVSWSGQTLAYVQGRHNRHGVFELSRMGLEYQGTDTLEDFAARLVSQGLGNHSAIAMLRPEQFLMLQIPAPAVPADELRAAVRYQVRDLVDVHIDDLTLDVLRVGNGEDKGADQVFVVTSPNANIRAVMDLANAAAWTVSIIDVHEMAQRNLQSLMAARNDLADRATACLMVVSDKQALLTVCAKGELYYSRRLDLPEGFIAMDWGSAAEFFDDEPAQAYTPVTEYVPDYGGGGFSTTGASSAGQSDSDRAQRVVVEVQRSLDLWDRTWTNLPMAGLTVYAGDRTFDLATWLSQEIGQAVTSLDLESVFPALASAGPQEKLACAPLLGVLLRAEGGAS